MVDLAHQLDPTRLVTAALLVRTRKRPQPVRLRSSTTRSAKRSTSSAPTNTSAGTSSMPEDADTTTWDIRYQKPLIMSEWGGDAKAGNHAPAATRTPLSGPRSIRPRSTDTRFPCSTRSRSFAAPVPGSSWTSARPSRHLPASRTTSTAKD